MSQTPVTVTYSLEEVLGQINQKLDNLQKDVTEIKIGQTRLEGEVKTFETELKGDIKTFETAIEGEFRTLETELKGRIDRLESELKGEIKALETEVKGIGKRLDTQEFINRSVVVGFVLAISAGVVKLFFPNFPN